MSLNTSNIIHIVVEVVALLSLTTYVIQQNRKMMVIIDSLTEKVEEQEEKIDKHDKVISDILKKMSKNKEISFPKPLPASNFLLTPTPKSSKPVSICLDNERCQEIFHNEEEEEHEYDEYDEYDDYEDEHKEEVEDFVEEQSLVEEEEEQHYEPKFTVFFPKVEEVFHQEQSISKVEELTDDQLEEVTLLEEEKVAVKEAVIPEVKDKKKKKKSASMSDIDKELEDELNDLYKEEIMSSHS